MRGVGIHTGTALPRRMATRVRVQVRPCFSGLPPMRGFGLECTVLLPCCTLMSLAVFLCFTFLDAWGFLGPLIFLEITLEVFFSIKTQTFLMKARQNTF